MGTRFRFEFKEGEILTYLVIEAENYKKLYSITDNKVISIVCSKCGIIPSLSSPDWRDIFSAAYDNKMNAVMITFKIKPHILLFGQTGAYQEGFLVQGTLI